MEYGGGDPIVTKENFRYRQSRDLVSYSDLVIIIFRQVLSA